MPRSSPDVILALNAVGATSEIHRPTIDPPTTLDEAIAVSCPESPRSTMGALPITVLFVLIPHELAGVSSVPHRGEPVGRMIHKLIDEIRRTRRHSDLEVHQLGVCLAHNRAVFCCS